MSSEADLRDSDLAPVDLRTRLARTWGSGTGLWGVLTTVHHKIIGRRYILKAFPF